MTDKFEIVIIELHKVEKAYQKNKNNALLQWIMFLLNTGKRIGKEQGLKQGSFQSKKQIAKKLLELNVPIEKVSEATELSVEEIKKFSNN